MDEDGAVTIHNSHAMAEARKAQFAAKVDQAKKLQGGTILEITNIEQAMFAEEAGVSCIKVSGASLQHLLDPASIRAIQHAVSIPVMAEVRGGHVAEAQMLQALGVDFILEGAQTLRAEENGNYINKHNFSVPFVSRCESLEEALVRATQGAAMVWTCGRVSLASLLSDSHGLIDTVVTVRSIMRKMRNLVIADEDQALQASRKMGVPYDTILEIQETGRLPVVNFASGEGIRSPVDAALMMQLGCDGVAIKNEVFNLMNPRMRVRGIVDAVGHYNDPNVLLEASLGLEDPFAEDE